MVGSLEVLSSKQKNKNMFCTLKCPPKLQIICRVNEAQKRRRGRNKKSKIFFKFKLFRFSCSKGQKTLLCIIELSGKRKANLGCKKRIQGLKETESVLLEERNGFFQAFSESAFSFVDVQQNHLL